ncbi:uncharacterized protein LOC142229974 [Haematobia irritans]|uniref:uncharacterized protein LOC142229974 n=1 Tax=Haematobia irritans TaxID=7368 RepID=UPI003F50A272
MSVKIKTKFCYTIPLFIIFFQISCVHSHPQRGNATNVDHYNITLPKSRMEDIQPWKNGCLENSIRESSNSSHNIWTKQWKCPPGSHITNIMNGKRNTTDSPIILKEFSNNTFTIEHTVPLENGCFQQTIKQRNPYNNTIVMANVSLICAPRVKSSQSIEKLLIPIATIIERSAPLENGCFEQITKEINSTHFGNFNIINEEFICPPGFNESFSRDQFDKVPATSSNHSTVGCHLKGHCNGEKRSNVGYGVKSSKGFVIVIFLSLLKLYFI